MEIGEYIRLIRDQIFRSAHSTVQTTKYFYYTFDMYICTLEYTVHNTFTSTNCTQEYRHICTLEYSRVLKIL